MSQVWYRNNKAAEKFSEEDIITILEDTLQFVQNDPSIILKTTYQHYLLTKHSVCRATLHSWVSKIHKDNKSIQRLYEAIENIIESRLVLAERGIRPTIQAMVLQNKHDYREKHEQRIEGGASIIINRPEKPKKKDG